MLGEKKKIDSSEMFVSEVYFFTSLIPSPGQMISLSCHTENNNIIVFPITVVPGLQLQNFLLTVSNQWAQST